MQQSNTVNLFRKRLERLVEIAIVLVFLILAGLLAKQYVFSSDTPKAIEIGDSIRLPDVAWNEAPNKTILLFLESDCKYSIDGVGFYTSIAKNISRSTRARIIAVFPDDDIGYQEFLKGAGLGELQTRVVNFRALGVLGKPTLLLVNSGGAVENIWKGVLTPKQENEVRALVGLPVIDFFLEELDLRNLLQSGKKFTIVDSRPRDEYAINHFENAINISADELSVRAINEIPVSETIAVYGRSTYDGELAQEVLSRNGFRNVFVLRFTPN